MTARCNRCHRVLSLDGNGTCACGGLIEPVYTPEEAARVRRLITDALDAEECFTLDELEAYARTHGHGD